MQPALVQVLLGQDRPDTSTGHAGFLEHLARGQASIVASCSASQIKARRFSFSVASCHACRREDARWIVGGKLRAGTRPRRALAGLHGEKVAPSYAVSENCHARVGEYVRFFQKGNCQMSCLDFIFRLCLPSLNTKRSRMDKKNAIIR